MIKHLTEPMAIQKSGGEVLDKATRGFTRGLDEWRRSVGLAASLVRANIRLSMSPFKLSHCLTYRCQSRCLTCNIWQLRPHNELTLPEILEFVTRNHDFGWVNLTGGEPFLREDIVEIAEAYAEFSRPYLLSVITNGLCPPEDVFDQVQEIIGLCPRMVMSLSLDGIESVHDKIRGIPGNYQRIIALARQLVQLQSKRFHLIFSYTMSRYNEGRLAETIEIVRNELGEDPRFEVNLAQNSEEYYHNSGTRVIPDPSSVTRDIRSLKKRHDIMGLLETGFLRGLEQYLSNGQMPVPSAELSSSLYLDSYGNVWPSIMWNERLGNIRETEYALDPIWNGERAKELRQKLSRGEGPQHWTRCEAYPSLLANLSSLIL